MRALRGVDYHETFEAARERVRALPARFRHSGRVVGFEAGYAVQLHRSGPYLGPGLPDPEAHACAWCPGDEEE